MVFGQVQLGEGEASGTHRYCLSSCCLLLLGDDEPSVGGSPGFFFFFLLLDPCEYYRLDDSEVPGEFFFFLFPKSTRFLESRSTVCNG